MLDQRAQQAAGAPFGHREVLGQGFRADGFPLDFDEHRQQFVQRRSTDIQFFRQNQPICCFAADGVSDLKVGVQRSNHRFVIQDDHPMVLSLPPRQPEGNGGIFIGAVSCIPEADSAAGAHGQASGDFGDNRHLAKTAGNFLNCAPGRIQDITTIPLHHKGALNFFRIVQ